VSGSAIDRGYVEWLLQESMLARGAAVASQFAGSGGMSQRSFAQSNPRAATEKASVWFTAYPISMITRAGESFLRMLADEDLWRLFEAIGVDAVHTGPVKRAGGISGWDVTPSVDGHFDRISTRIDEAFGTEVEFRSLCEVAAAHGGTIIDDIVPGHTGKGADFRLAEMKVGDYPGIYHMVEIPPEDWHLLPPVPQGKDSVNLDMEAEDRLEKAGHAVSNKALLVMVHRLDSGLIQVTVLNFSSHQISDQVVSEHLRPGAMAIDMFSKKRLGPVDQWRTFPISLSPHQGMSVLVVNTPEADRFANAVGREHTNGRGRTPS
jgi:hypothetical protein